MESIQYRALGKPDADNARTPYALIDTDSSPPHEVPNFDSSGGSRASRWATELFTHYSGTTNISGAFSDPSMRHHIPTLVGLAANDNPGSEIETSDDLSLRSSRLVQHAMARGIIWGPGDNNPEGLRRNDISMHRQSYHADIVAKMAVNAQHGWEGTILIPPHRVLQARQFVRQALGRGKKAEITSEVAHQDSLPGLE